MRNEPLMTAGVLTAIVAALLTVLETFGVPITPDQQDALNQFIAVLAPIVVAFVARSQVTPLTNPKAENTRGQLVSLVPVDGSRLRGK